MRHLGIISFYKRKQKQTNVEENFLFADFYVPHWQFKKKNSFCIISILLLPQFNVYVIAFHQCIIKYRHFGLLKLFTLLKD